jgi:hypothetical protein
MLSNPLKERLTSAQFSDLVKRLPEVRSLRQDLAELVKSKPERIKEILGESSTWSSIYELSFVKQLAYLFILLGMHEQIIEAGMSLNPTQAFLQMSADGGELDQWFDKNEANIDLKHLLWLSLILQRNILSIMLFHQSLGALVNEVRSGNDEALFKAVSVDRSILSCPTFADRLSRAELINDKQFFIHLRKALKGPSKKNMAAIGDLRYAIVMLRELGFEKFTDNELIDFFVKNRLYPNHPSAAKNLRKHIQAARKYTTT